MVAFAASLLLLNLQQAQVHLGIDLPEPGKAPSRLMLAESYEKLDPPKVSPKQKWLFEWVVKGYVQTQPGSPQRALRMRIFSQEHRTFDDKAPMVARMAMRLWELNYFTLRMDHAYQYNGQVVDFYLCYGGKAGGEQLFGQDDEGGRNHPVNTVYIYDLNSFLTPLQMAREVAHEYGHATLVPIGGYDEPEDWANGYLGEKLYLKYLRDEIAAKRLSPEDAMGAGFHPLDQWVKANVDPLVRSAAQHSPFEMMKGKSKASMDAFLGLVLYENEILPAQVFAKSIQTIGSASALDYPKAVEHAVADKPTLSLHIPAILKGKPLWVPLGNGAVRGADILTKSRGWAKIQPRLGAVVTLAGVTATE